MNNEEDTSPVPNLIWRVSDEQRDQPLKEIVFAALMHFASEKAPYHNGILIDFGKEEEPFTRGVLIACNGVAKLRLSQSADIDAIFCIMLDKIKIRHMNLKNCSFEFLWDSELYPPMYDELASMTIKNVVFAKGFCDPKIKIEAIDSEFWGNPVYGSINSSNTPEFLARCGAPRVSNSTPEGSLNPGSSWMDMDWGIKRK